MSVILTEVCVVVINSPGHTVPVDLNIKYSQELKIEDTVRMTQRACFPLRVQVRAPKPNQD